MLTVAVCAAVALFGCGGDEGSSAGSTVANAPVVEGVKPRVAVPDGPPPKNLVIKDLKKGTGKEAKVGGSLTVQFVAIRWNGEPFQSSWDSGSPEPFSFELGHHQVNPAWEKGIPGMRVGGRRELVVPPKFIYYPTQYPGRKSIREPKDSLVYVVELLSIP